MDNSQPVILLNITHGFQARLLLRTSIRTRLLSKGAELIIVAENASEAYFREEFENEMTTLVSATAEVGKLERGLVKLRQYFLMNPKLGVTLNSKREAFLRRSSILKRLIVDYGNSVFGKIPFLRDVYLNIESALFSGKEFDDLLRRFDPDLIVTGTPGFNSCDAHLLRAAERMGITSATVMLSWDNLTSKGYMAAKPDYLLVWSDLMANEARELHGFASDRILKPGAAQFDHYQTEMSQQAIRDWKIQHGIGADSKLIVYGTINPALLPHEQTIVRDVASAIRSLTSDDDYFFWIRLHPQMVKGPYAVAVDGLLSLESENVKVELPEVQSERLSWDLPKDDAVHLRALLGAADVLVTTCSTLVIDAACLDTPIINIFFDGSGSFDATYSAARFKNYTHYEKILSTCGIAVADSVEEFVCHVHEYIRDPAIDSFGRKNILKQQLGNFDGNAGLRTADQLLLLAEKTSRRSMGPGVTGKS